MVVLENALLKPSFLVFLILHLPCPHLSQEVCLITPQLSFVSIMFLEVRLVEAEVDFLLLCSVHLLGSEEESF
jgi:hypothetical protein